MKRRIIHIWDNPDFTKGKYELKLECGHIAFMSITDAFSMQKEKKVPLIECEACEDAREIYDLSDMD